MFRSCSISHLTTVLFRMLFVFCRRNVCERKYELGHERKITSWKSIRETNKKETRKIWFETFEGYKYTWLWTIQKSLRKMCSIHQMKLLSAIMQRLRLHQWPCQHDMSKKSAQNVQHLQIETFTGESTCKCSWYASCFSQRTIMKERFQRHLGSSDDHWSRYLRNLVWAPTQTNPRIPWLASFMVSRLVAFVAVCTVFGVPPFIFTCRKRGTEK